jgi:hypothetical protein
MLLCLSFGDRGEIFTFRSAIVFGATIRRGSLNFDDHWSLLPSRISWLSRCTLLNSVDLVERGCYRVGELRR